MAQARMLLRSATAIRITAQQANDLTDEAGFDEREGLPYLLRAVGDADGVFKVNHPSVLPNGDVWIGGDASSKCPVAKQRPAVVVWLDKMPETV